MSSKFYIKSMQDKYSIYIIIIYQYWTHFLFGCFGLSIPKSYIDNNLHRCICSWILLYRSTEVYFSEKYPYQIFIYDLHNIYPSGGGLTTAVSYIYIIYTHNLSNFFFFFWKYSLSVLKAIYIIHAYILVISKDLSRVKN